MARRKPTPRSERRAGARDAGKLARDRERLARLEPGGSPGRPLEIESASQVEPHARAARCLRCDGPCDLVEHAAETVGGERLRVARLLCGRCGAPREMWLRIVQSLPS